MRVLDVASQPNPNITKKLFTFNSPTSDGLLISIHETSTRKGTRFTYCDFQSSGTLLALSNNEGHIYIIDFLANKFWKLTTLESCTCVKLSEYNENQILLAKTNGVIEVLNVDSGETLSKLLGHEHSVQMISFSSGNTCMSASKYEAIIWDLNTYSKLQMLSLEKECVLKFVLYIPTSNHVLVCYKDDIVQIWQNESFDNLKQFQPSNWKSHSIKSLSFTRNGKIMAVCGYPPIIVMFCLDTWKLIKVITLPDCINTVKKIQFIPQNFDGGFNRMLTILSGNGLIYFFNVEEDLIISELKSKYEIINYSIASINVQYICCLLSSGEIEVYDAHHYIRKHQGTIVSKAQESGKFDQKVILKKYWKKKSDAAARHEMSKILERNKLKAIIEEYQEFPEAFRSNIWEKILKLPNNIQQYNSIVNHIGIAAFENLEEEFPLEDKVAVRCLRHLLNNLVSWCPYLANVESLPCLFFPFVKVFHKKPIACFELCCTIIINWCQHWFEYHPLPPINVMAMIFNMLLEHDVSLSQHFSQNVYPITHTWNLLETAFSEVLYTKDWLMFWDHVFINEPAFLLCAVVAFIILQRNYLLLVSKEDNLNDNFHFERPLDVKKFIRKTYEILDNTSPKNHPRQFLNEFTSLARGSYPVFEEYPKSLVNFQIHQVDRIENQLKEMTGYKEKLLKEHRDNYGHDVIRIEEEKRIAEVERASYKKIKGVQERLSILQKELELLKNGLQERGNEVMNDIRENCKCKAKVDKQFDTSSEGVRINYNTDINPSDVTHDRLSRSNRKKLKRELEKDSRVIENLRSRRQWDNVVQQILKVDALINIVKTQLGNEKHTVKKSNIANERLPSSRKTINEM